MTVADGGVGQAQGEMSGVRMCQRSADFYVPSTHRVASEETQPRTSDTPTEEVVCAKPRNFSHDKCRHSPSSHSTSGDENGRRSPFSSHSLAAGCARDQSNTGVFPSMTGMTGIVSSRRRLCVAAFVLVSVALAGSSIPVAAQSALATSVAPATRPVLSLANPNSGDVVLHGNYVVSGMAYDPNVANGGNGIERVDLFLGPRDSGGLFLGSAVPGRDNDFQVEITIPGAMTGGREFIAYAYSTVDGAMTSVSVPVYVGEAPTATPTTSNSSTRPAELSTTQDPPAAGTSGSGASNNQPANDDGWAAFWAGQMPTGVD